MKCLKYGTSPSSTDLSTESKQINNILTKAVKIASALPEKKTNDESLPPLKTPNTRWSNVLEKSLKSTSF